MAKAVASLLSDLAALNATSLLSMTANEDGCWPTPALGASLHFAKNRNKKKSRKLSGNTCCQVLDPRTAEKPKSVTVKKWKRGGSSGAFRRSEDKKFTSMLSLTLTLKFTVFVVSFLSIVSTRLS